MSDGLKTDYYNIPTNNKDFIDVNHIAMVMNMNCAEFTILKSLIGVNVTRRSGSTRHSGTTVERDLNKMLAYIDVIKEFEGE